MTDQELTGHFDQIGRQFDHIGRQFEAMNQRFDGMDRRFDAMDQRFDGVDRQLAETNARLERVEDTARHLDVEVHRQGIMADERHAELRLATEAFGMLQRVTNTKIDGLRDAIDQRLVPLELTVRSHSDDITQHARQLKEGHK